MALRVGSLRRTDSVAIEGIADIRRSLAARRSDANDPTTDLGPVDRLPKCPRYPLTNPRQFDILQFAPG